jgi:tRNA pseudouridine13 synthase
VTIRRTPEDFRVEERCTAAFLAGLAPERDLSRPFAAFTLAKKSIATPDALRFVARALGVPPGLVRAAGIKDRHAVTRQTITIDAAAFRRSAPRVFDGDGWSLEFLGYAARPADSSIIASNRFDIVVRALDRRACDELVRRAEFLATREGVGFVNYFGDQRFGSARHGEGFPGRAVAEGDFERALRLAIGTPARKDIGATRTLTRALATHWGDWPAALAAIPRMPERAAIDALAAGADFRDAFLKLPRFTQEIVLDAYQSFLWNAIARRLARAVADETAQGAYEAPDDFGALVSPRASALTPATRALAIPMPGAGVSFDERVAPHAAAAFADEALDPASLDRTDLGGLRFGSAPRAFVAVARDLTISPPEQDEFAGGGRANLAATLAFDLPRGSYATVLLRALGQ